MEMVTRMTKERESTVVSRVSAGKTYADVLGKDVPDVNQTRVPGVRPTKKIKATYQNQRRIKQ